MAINKRRRTFLKQLLLLMSTTSLNKILSQLATIPSETAKMPVLFVGHGSPENVLEDNPFTRALKDLGKRLPKPKAIACISAHWLTKGSWVQLAKQPKQIYDFYGFPPQLYKVQYTPMGAPQWAKQLCEQSKGIFKPTKRWGIDHGTWTILYHLFPKADVPVFQISIDYYKPLTYHAEVAKVLRFLREKGILIIGSGNITHNLYEVCWNNKEGPAETWAASFDEAVKKTLDKGAYGLLCKPEKLSSLWQQAHPEPSHWIPLIYTAFLHDSDKEPISYPYEGFQYGTISMRCVLFGKV